MVARYLLAHLPTNCVEVGMCIKSDSCPHGTEHVCVHMIHHL